jgi:hypothetical protein
MTLSLIWPIALLAQLYYPVAGFNLPVGSIINARFTEIFKDVYFISVHTN